MTYASADPAVQLEQMAASRRREKGEDDALAERFASLAWKMRARRGERREREPGED